MSCEGGISVLSFAFIGGKRCSPLSLKSSPAIAKPVPFLLEAQFNLKKVAEEGGMSRRCNTAACICVCMCVYV
jgi:hypothetical protein